MISFLRGHVIEIGDESATLDVHGVGYHVHCTSPTLETLTLNKEKAFFIHTSVKEDSISLFGFLNQKEKQLFLSLLKVDRVGPKMAMKVMSGGKPDLIFEAIESGDVKVLSGLPRVGKKLAEQIIFKLKGKVDFEFAGTPLDADKEKIQSALINLGFKSTEVEKIVGDLPANVSIEEGVRQGLSALAGGF